MVLFFQVARPHTPEGNASCISGTTELVHSTCSVPEDAAASQPLDQSKSLGYTVEKSNRLSPVLQLKSHHLVLPEEFFYMPCSISLQILTILTGCFLKAFNYTHHSLLFFFLGKTVFKQWSH